MFLDANHGARQGASEVYLNSAHSMTGAAWQVCHAALQAVQPSARQGGVSWGQALPNIFVSHFPCSMFWRGACIFMHVFTWAYIWKSTHDISCMFMRMGICACGLCGNQYTWMYKHMCMYICVFFFDLLTQCAYGCWFVVTDVAVNKISL